MKKFISSVCALMLMATCVTFSACSNEGDDKDKKEQTSKKSTTGAKPQTVANRKGEMPNYRYVDSDTLLARYNLAKDYQEEMMRQQNNYDNTARQREAAIQSLMAKYQKQAQSNSMDEAAYQKAMADVQKRQQAAEKELGQMQVNMQNQMMEAQKIVNDSIMNYIDEYNKSHGYDAIFMKAATLYISPDLDITDEILEGLNARYNMKK